MRNCVALLSVVLLVVVASAANAQLIGPGGGDLLKALQAKGQVEILKPSADLAHGNAEYQRALSLSRYNDAIEARADAVARGATEAELSYGNTLIGSGDVSFMIADWDYSDGDTPYHQGVTLYEDGVDMFDIGHWDSAEQDFLAAGGFFDICTPKLSSAYQKFVQATQDYTSAQQYFDGLD